MPGRSTIKWHNASVTRERRERQNGHRGAVVWFTGLSGSGKSTLAHTVEEQLYLRGCRTIVLDGDNVRHGLCSDLDFSPSGRTENVRRIGEVAKLFVDAGVIALTAFISPLRRDRARVQSVIGPTDFLEIYCQCPLAVCERRDTKGLYRLARAGGIQEFTGISAPYEQPTDPDLVLCTDTEPLDTTAAKVLELLEFHGVFRIPPEPAEGSPPLAPSKEFD